MTAAEKVRVLVVEDSRTVRAHLVEALARDPEIAVVGEAEDGKRAIELCQHLRPDVVTLDMMLPIMTGLAVTEYVMAYCPTPILIVSASTNRGELFRTYEALAAGAVDVLEKPRDGEAEDARWERRFVDTVKLVSRIRVITHLRGRLGSLGRGGVAPLPAPVSPAEPAGARLVAIGASTGGPGALVQILKSLPASFPLPMLVVVHIGQPFGLAFADWLDGQSAIRVAFARDGEPVPAAGTARVVLAPPDRHLVVRGGRLWISDDPERHACRPSVDVLFESIAAEGGGGVIAGLLTGMGKDGALGLLALRRAGGITFAQDEASSIVFGMPHEAIAAGAAQHVVPLAGVAGFLAQRAAAVTGRSAP